ncbi:hypothetical protein [Psychromonas aquatilis]|uniref:Uncharacterized protein n=1 Tax=Psychromonas aquatilis TaxID=2005072 RepID=A0ABU9GQ87_9GAMM
MALEKAYSNEYQEVINAELAYELFWAGVIKNKSDFQCPSDVCSAKVTCINLDSEKQNMLQIPHFRGYRHAKDCEVVSGNSTKELTGENQDREVAPDVFCLTRPEKQLTQKTISKLNHKEKVFDNTTSTKQTNNTSINRSAYYYSVRSIVNQYLRYRKEDSLGNNSINIAKQAITYQALFKGVFKQPLEKLPNTGLIYWGVAFINYLADIQCYKVTFKEPLTTQGNMIKPSLFISQQAIDAYPMKNLLLKRLQTVSALKDKRAFVFVYGKPAAKSEKYINFEINNLDFLEIRYLDLFDELKK